MNWNGKKTIYTKSALLLWGSAARGVQRGFGQLVGDQRANNDEAGDDPERLVEDESGADGPYCYVDDGGQRYEVDIWDPELVEAMQEAFAREAAEKRRTKT